MVHTGWRKDQQVPLLVSNKTLKMMNSGMFFRSPVLIFKDHPHFQVRCNASQSGHWLVPIVKMWCSLSSNFGSTYAATPSVYMNSQSNSDLNLQSNSDFNTRSNSDLIHVVDLPDQQHQVFETSVSLPDVHQESAFALPYQREIPGGFLNES